jgi:hypothetical protein
MNEDLTAVRELTDVIASSRREASLARSWLAITERQQLHPQRTMVRRLVPVAAGLVVLMLAAAGWFLVGPGSEGSHKALPADGESVPIAQAWDAIIAAAQTAQATTVPDGSIIYVSQTGEGAAITYDDAQWKMIRQDRGSWLDPRGMVFLMFRQDGQDVVGSKAPTGPPAQPSLVTITPQWIASLPTDPDTLRALLLRQSKDTAGDWSNRHGLWEDLAELFRTSDFAIPLDVRIAIYRVMAQEKGLAANLTTVDGHNVYVISRVERDDVQQLVFDPDTGRCIGKRSLFLGNIPFAPADRVVSWSIWEQHLVAKVGDDK